MRLKQERLLAEPVSAYVRRKSFSKQTRELQFYEFRIDLYGFSRAKDLTIAIELKLHNWRRAIEQALIYQLCSDLVFIAVPENTIARIDGVLLQEHGIGLLAVEGVARCRQILAPSLSHVVRPHYREAYIELLQREAT
jgi:hypothetical protein